MSNVTLREIAASVKMSEGSVKQTLYRGGSFHPEKFANMIKIAGGPDNWERIVGEFYKNAANERNYTGNSSRVDYQPVQQIHL